jgi:hypothetical protein
VEVERKQGVRMELGRGKGIIYGRGMREEANSRGDGIMEGWSMGEWERR